MEKLRDTGPLPRKVPSHEVTYCRLRDMILFGQLTPGQPVTIQGLTEQLDGGMTPVREAIRRLTAEGALELQGNRRVCVPNVASAQLEELAFARLTIEPHMAKMACNALDKNDIKQLEQIDGELNRAIDSGDVQRYLLNNFRFHFALYEHARTPILLSMVRSLWLRFGPSLRVVCGRFGTSNLPDRHEEALAAIRTRDAAALALAIEQDIRQGIDQVRASITKTNI
ncbi:MAG: GntR family transcriptional regulator [Rhodobacteraceae bacterium]|nr:GntR family transcriptional regulator [Paracoccaceae bacterium]MCP5341674.1 GntR family transcriptional regulator [Paracoccaceae bacterium]